MKKLPCRIMTWLAFFCIAGTASYSANTSERLQSPTESQLIVLAQAGSAGGTIGKQDKTISGGGEGREEPSERSSPRTSPKRIPQFDRSNDANPKTDKAGDPKTFVNPTVNGMRIDWCTSAAGLAGPCGEPSASAWCRMKGLSRAINFKMGIGSSAYRLADHSVCNFSCGQLTLVICE